MKLKYALAIKKHGLKNGWKYSKMNIGREQT